MPGSPLVRKETWVEILGYAGTAAAVAGTLVAFVIRANLSEGGALAIALVVTAVLVAAGLAIGDGPADVYQRMRSVLWFAGVGSFALAAGIFSSSILNLGAKTAVTLAGGLAAGLGLLLWLMLRRSLQQIAFFLMAAGTITSLAVPSSVSSPSRLNHLLLVLWVCGFVWFIAGTLETARPPRTARVLGAVVSLLSSLEMFGSSFWLSLSLTALTSLALLGVGDRREDRAVSGLGIVGILIATAVGVSHVVGRSEGGAVAAIAIGLALLGSAIVAVRMGSAALEPPIPPIPPPPVADYDR